MEKEALKSAPVIPDENQLLKSVRSCDEAGDFHDVTLAWNDDEF